MPVRLSFVIVQSVLDGLSALSIQSVIAGCYSGLLGCRGGGIDTNSWIHIRVSIRSCHVYEIEMNLADKSQHAHARKYVARIDVDICIGTDDTDSMC